MLLDRLIELIAPMQCVSCQAEGPAVCAWCWPDLLTPVAERCAACYKLSPDSQTCPSCRKRQSLPTHVWVRTEYDQWSKQLLHRLKFQRAYSIGALLADYIEETLPYLDPETIVTHIPTAPKRIRTRGYDQAQLIARAIAKKQQLRYKPLLERQKDARQTGASKSARQKQMEHAFRVTSRAGRFVDSPVLLVDDMYTTGATLAGATKTLKQAGYKKIYAAVFAQKL